MTQLKSMRLLVVLFLLVSGFSWSQGRVADKEITSEWTLLDVRSGVEVYVQRQDCALFANQLPLEFLLFKVVNTNAQAMNVSYRIQSMYTEGCVGCDDIPETMINMTVNGSSELVGTCEEMGQGLYVLLNNRNLKKGWTFQSVQLNKFTVNPAK